MIKLNIIETFDQYLTKQFEISEDDLKEWKITEEQLKAFVADPMSVEEDIHDIIMDMIGCLDPVLSLEDFDLKETSYGLL